MMCAGSEAVTSTCFGGSMPSAMMAKWTAIGARAGPREAEVLVDEQDQKPEADDQAFLSQERAGADVQEEIHHGIRFESTAIEPSHGK